MTAVLGGAEIQILANAAGLEANITRQLQPVGAALNRQLSQAVQGASRSFDKLGDAARESLSDVDFSDALDSIADGVEDAGDLITRELGDASEDAARLVEGAFDGVAERIGDQLDIDNEFEAITASMKSDAADLADRLEQEFKGAGDRIEGELRDISDVDFGTGLKAEAGRVADQLVNEFDGVGTRIGNEISADELVRALDSIVSDSRHIADEVVDSFDGTGEKIGNEISSGAESALAGLPTKIAALGIGVAITATFLEGIDQEAITDRFAGSLALSDAEAAKFGETAGRLYAQAYGDSFEDVAETLRAAVAIEVPDDQIEAVVAQAESMGVAFDGAATEYLTLADQLRNQGVTESVTEGLDLITASFQQLPQEMQAPLTDAVREYGTFMDNLGFSTAETFGVLTNAAADGEFALDKTGDALKEFSIRATDLSTGSVDAFNTLGLSAEDMANQILAGGDTARGAFDEIINGLLEIEDPALQANTAIALFGTPLEDIGVTQIPAFLEGLSDMESGMGDVEGAAERLDKQINDNFATNLTSFKRSAQQAFVGLADAIGAPLLNVVNPLLQDFVVFLQEKGPEAAERFSAFIEPLFASLGDIISSIDLGAVFESLGDAAEGIDLSDIFGGIDGQQIADTLVAMGSAAGELIPAIVELAANLGGAGLSTFATLAPILAELAVDVLPPLADVLGVVAQAFGLITANVPGEVLVGAVVAFKAINTAMKVNTALTAAGGLVNYIKNIGLVSKVTQAWAVAQKVLNLSLLANPIGITIAAVAALGAAFVIAYKNSETFRGIVQSVLEKLEPLVDIAKQVGEAFGQFLSGDFGGGFDTLKDAAGDLVGFLGDLGGQAATALGGALLDGLQAAASSFPDVFDGLLSAARDLPNLIFDIARSIAEGFVDIIVNILDAVGLDFLIGPYEAYAAGVLAVFDGLAAALGFAWDLAIDVIEGAVDVIGGIIDGAQAVWDTGVLQTVFDVLATAIGLVWETIETIITDAVAAVGFIIDGAEAVWDTGILQAVFDGLSAAIELVWSGIEAIIDGYVTSIGAVIDGASAIWDTGALQAVFDGLEAAWDATLGFATGVVDGFVEGVKSVLGFFGLGGGDDEITDEVGSVFDPLEGLWDAALGLALAPINKTIDVINGIFDTFGIDIGFPSVEEVFDGLEGLWDSAWGSATGVVSGVGDTINGFLGDNFGVKIGKPSLETLFDNVGSFWDTAWGTATGVVSGVGDRVNEFLGENFGVKIGMPSVENVFNSLEAIWDTAFGFAVDVIDRIIDTINGILGAFGIDVGLPSVEEAFDTLEGIWDNTFGAAADVVDSIVTRIGEILAPIEELWNIAQVLGIWNTIGLLWDAGLQIALGFLEDFIDNIAGFFGDIIDDATKWGEDLLGQVTDGLEQVGEFLTDKFEEFQEFIGDILTDILESEVATFFGDLISSFTDKFEEIVGVVSDKFEEIVGVVSDKLETVRAFISDKLEAARTIAVDIFERLKTGLERTVTQAKDLVVAVFERLKTGLERTVTQAKDLVLAVFERLKTGAERIVGEIKDAIEGPFQAVKDFLSGLFDGLSLGNIDISGLTSKLDTVIEKINVAIRAFNSIPGVPDIPTVPTGGGGSQGSGRSFTPTRTVSNFMSEGGLATVPSMVAEDFKPEIVLPLTKPDRMLAIIAGYSNELVAAAGGADAITAALLGEEVFASITAPVFQVQRGDIVPPASGNAAPPAGPRPQGQANGFYDQSNHVTHNHFYGMEAGTVAKQMRDRDKSVIQGLRVRP